MPEGVGYPEQPTAMDPNNVLQRYFPGLDPAMISPEFIESLTIGMAMMQAELQFRMIEQKGLEMDLGRDQIELEKAKIAFEIEQAIPFKTAQMEFQTRIQDLQLQEAQVGLDAARERTLQAQEGTLQAKEQTKQAEFATQRANLDYNTGLINNMVARSSDRYNRNYTTSASARQFLGI